MKFMVLMLFILSPILTFANGGDIIDDSKPISLSLFLIVLLGVLISVGAFYEALIRKIGSQQLLSRGTFWTISGIVIGINAIVATMLYVEV